MGEGSCERLFEKWNSQVEFIVIQMARSSDTGPNESPGFIRTQKELHSRKPTIIITFL